MLFDIIAIGILATIGMTLFSYLISFLFGKNAKEPQLLNILVSRIGVGPKDLNREHVIGWAIHFIIGLLFTVLYFLALDLKWLNSGFTDGILYGLIAGIIGILGWKFFEVLHPDPPSSLRLLFYIQLIPAHIIFGFCLSWLISLNI
jgi:hypothetical protein